MSAKIIIEQMIADVSATKEQGYDNISTDNLLTYLDNLNSKEHYDHDIQMELLKSNNAASIEEMKLNHATEIEVFRSVITVGANAAKAGMLINGGAAVSLLAFLGNIWNKSTVPTAFSSLSLALLYFVLGVLCAGGCTGLTYLSQFSYANSGLGTNIYWRKSGHTFNTLAALTWIASLVLFGFGAYTAYISMGKQLG